MSSGFMLVVEVLARIVLGLLACFSTMQSGVYCVLLVKEGPRAETFGGLIGSLFMLWLGVWGFRKLAARSARRASQ
jgi:hypothetical protein